MPLVHVGAVHLTRPSPAQRKQTLVPSGTVGAADSDPTLPQFKSIAITLAVKKCKYFFMVVAFF